MRTSLKKSCAVALPIERNSATFTHKSATTTATRPQPISLKALANKVLERNSYRNLNATSPDNGAQLLRENEPQKLRIISALGNEEDRLQDSPAWTRGPGEPARQINCQAFEHNGVMMSTHSEHCREWQGSYCHGCELFKIH
jgi:hypothetical protein